MVVWHRFILWCLLIGTMATGDAFIPQVYHGRWIVRDHPPEDGMFHVGSDGVRAQLRSAEVAMSPDWIQEETVFFHNLTVCQRPSLWDMRRMMKSMHRFHEIRQNGLLIQILSDPKTNTEDRLRVRLTLSGVVHEIELIRMP